MIIRAATPQDLPAIMEIYNHAVEQTTAIWNETPVDLPNRLAWFKARVGAGLPVLVAEDEAGEVMGYASYGPWRAFDGFRETVEHSVYVRVGHYGRGTGRLLMEALIAQARAQGLHVMVAGIEAGNVASIALHERLGFVQTGLMPQVGMKFGRWLDLAFLQLTLDSRQTP